MKKIFLLLLMTIVVMVNAYANSVQVTLKSGSTLYGEFVNMSDSVLQIQSDGTGKVVNIKASIAKKVSISKIGKYIVDNDRFVPSDSKLPSPSDIVNDSRFVPAKINSHKESIVTNRKEIGDKNQHPIANKPNYLLAKAIKTSGSVALGIGVPCLAAGLLTCIAGNVGPQNLVSNYAGYTAQTLVDKEETYAKCIEASYYLFGAGAAMTIVGIPLYVSGKKIMELDINYTGNGAGFTMKF